MDKDCYTDSDIEVFKRFNDILSTVIEDWSHRFVVDFW